MTEQREQDGKELYLLELIAVRAKMADLIKPNEFFQAVDFINSLYNRLGVIVPHETQDTAN